MPPRRATGRPFGFSFSRGRNAHFPDTGKTFQEGVKRYLRGEGGDGVAAVAAAKAGGAAVQKKNQSFSYRPPTLFSNRMGRL
jgi:hypothetical protein